MPAAQAHTDEPTTSKSAMQKAWKFLAQPSWPASLEATLADPLRSRLVHTYARVLERRWSRDCRLPIDQKRAAAGDTAD